jgi:Acetyltransferase (GNAT) domain
MSVTWQALKGERIDEAWKEICLNSRAATFFHTKTWADVLSASFPHWSVRPVALEFSDGNLMVLPLMRRKGLLGENYIESMLPGVYGGPVFLRTPTEEQWSAVWRSVNKFPNIVIVGNPFLPPLGSPDAVLRDASTQVLDLAAGFDQIRKGFRKGHQANLKAARRAGVEIRMAQTLPEVDAYFDIYQNTLARWGKKAGGFYPRALFHNLFGLPGYGQSVKLWLAFHKEKAVAGGWLFYNSAHAVYWHSAVRENYMAYHPVHALVTTAIEDSCTAGFRWFDFNPSGGLNGVEHFKRGFGTKRLEFSVYRRLGPMGKAFRLSRHLRESVLHTCPL